MNITLFAVPKPWKGHINTIQRNAVRSWLRQKVDRVILFENSEGTADACNEFGLEYVPTVKHTKLGTPIIGDVFAKMERMVQPDDICIYINADIIFSKDGVLKAVLVACKKDFNEFLAVAGKQQVVLNEELITEKAWKRFLRKHDAQLKVRWGGTDVFIFTPGALANMPPFALGRGRWDAWPFAHTQARSIPSINITPVLHTIHQSHDFKHLPDSVDKQYRNKVGQFRWSNTQKKGPETAYNKELLLKESFPPQKGKLVSRCTHVLTYQGSNLKVVSNG